MSERRTNWVRSVRLQADRVVRGARRAQVRLKPDTTYYGIHAVIAGIGMLVVTLAGASQDPAKRSVWDGVYTAEQAKRGETLYGQSCASCHGTTLEGGEMAPPLAGGQFNSNWTGLSIGDLFERMRISMPQSNPGSLSRQQYADVLAYMLSAGSFPAGKIELPRDVETLKQIGFEALKP